jgi:hypothetical protein
MGGLSRIARALGGITIQGKKFVWDYALDKAVPEEEMTDKRREASDKAWAEELKRHLGDKSAG